MRAAFFMRYSRDRELIVPFDERRDTGSPAVRYPDQWKRIFLAERAPERKTWSKARRWIYKVWAAAA